MSQSEPVPRLKPSFPIAVVFERRPSISPWAEYSWDAAGITVGRHADSGQPRLIRVENGIAYFLFGGLDVTPHVDECESYYHNMMSGTPRAYVVARLEDANDVPDPFLVSMSFDEAHAYLEGDDAVYAVDIPPELYRWIEAYVIANYFPEKKIKRKLQNWSGKT